MLRLRNHLELIQLYGLKIPDINIILGLPWIKKHQRERFYDSKKITFSSGYRVWQCNHNTRTRHTKKDTSKYEKKSLHESVKGNNETGLDNDVLDNTIFKVSPKSKKKDILKGDNKNVLLI